MSIGALIKQKQPEEFKKLLLLKKYIKIRDGTKKENFRKMMRHDSYKRINGAIRQVRN